MMRHSAIVGCSFGDEGKGNFTNYLCQDINSPLVIRFSGGQQAGHTVVNDGVKHVFSSFGSGSLSGVPTYLSEFCSINPDSILGELEVLLKKNVEPMLFINNKCPITTPMEIRRNRHMEYIKHHGSCGAGFGATIEREESYYSLTLRDMFYPKILKEKLRLIQEYYCDRESCDRFLELCDYVVNSKYIKAVDKIPSGYNYILRAHRV